MGFIFSQLFVRPTYPGRSCVGKTVIVTGSNVGLGKEAARHFVRLGADTLILAVRSLDKGQAAKEDIERTTSCGKDVVQVWEVDMASYDSVTRFASRVSSDLDRVDIFVANAGVARSTFTMAEKDEATITVNVVSTFLLAALVMPKMKETADRFQTRPTFSITSSEVHGHTDFPQKSAPEGKIFATVSDETLTENFKSQYPVSKLLEVLGVRAIAEKNPASRFPVTINCLNPGLCHSELAREGNTVMFRLFKLVLARTTEVGSRTLVHAGTSGAETHGQYLHDCAVSSPAPFVLSAEGKVAQDRVWAELVAKLEAIQPGVTNNF